MNQHETPCSDEMLLSLLQSDDDLGEIQDAAVHLERCGRCQARIEELAGEQNHWRLVHESLHSDDIDSGGDRPQRQWGAARLQTAPAAWTESMAKQLLSPPSHPEMLGRIGRYEVERVIGSGGMGVVFKAFDTELNRPVAVKVLAPYLVGSGAARKRFAREARAAAAIVHEHVVAIYNVETDGASPFLVMHFVAGESLQQRLDREGPLELCEILRIGMQTASGLAAAHGQGLVHRDIKPSNILLERGVERTLITDFGLARASDDASLTHTGYHPGTPQYMSPEQARGDAVDARSDLFSLGSVMYTMCAGRPPFRAENSYGILRKITDGDPRPLRDVNPAIPEWLERLIAQLLNKSADQRFQSADHVAGLLRKCLAHVQQPTVVDLPIECQSLPVQRYLDRVSRRVLVVMSLAIVCVASLFFLASVFFREDTANPTTASPSAQSAAADRHESSYLEWDESGRALQTFDQDLKPLEFHFEQPWDDVPEVIRPVPTPSKDDANTLKETIKSP